MILILLPLVFSCRDGEKENPESGAIQYEDREISTDTSSQGENADLVEESATEKDGVQTEETEEEAGEEPANTETTQKRSLAGDYIRVDPPEPPDGCNCYCVEVSFSTPTELCISPNDIYISARFTRNGDNKANVYFVEMLKATGTETEIPWGDFDKTTPIATASLQPDGSVKLDWLGFAIDGEIAVDYAIYGKKSLEGIYKRK